MRQRFLGWVLFAACSVTVTACGGSTTTDGTDATSDATGTDTSAGDVAADVPRVDAGDFCTEAAARAARCGKSFDAARCAKDATCYGAVLKPDDATVYMGCLTKSDCSVSEDSCLVTAAAKYGSDPATQAYSKACLDKRAACGGGFADDLCSLFHGALQPTYLDKAKACFDQPCASVKDCYDAIFKAAGCR